MALQSIEVEAQEMTDIEQALTHEGVQQGLGELQLVHSVEFDDREVEYLALAEKPGMQPTAMFLLWSYRNRKAGYVRIPYCELPTEDE